MPTAIQIRRTTYATPGEPLARAGSVTADPFRGRACRTDDAGTCRASAVGGPPQAQRIGKHARLSSRSCCATWTFESPTRPMLGPPSDCPDAAPVADKICHELELSTIDSALLSASDDALCSTHVMPILGPILSVFLSAIVIVILSVYVMPLDRLSIIAPLGLLARAITVAIPRFILLAYMPLIRLTTARPFPRSIAVAWAPSSMRSCMRRSVRPLVSSYACAFPHPSLRTSLQSRVRILILTFSVSYFDSSYSSFAASCVQLCLRSRVLTSARQFLSPLVAPSLRPSPH